MKARQGCLVVVFVLITILIANYIHSLAAKSYARDLCQNSGGLRISKIIPKNSSIAAIKHGVNWDGNKIVLKDYTLANCNEDLLCEFKNYKYKLKFSDYEDEKYGEDIDNIYAFFYSPVAVSENKFFPQVKSIYWNIVNIKNNQSISSYRQVGYNGSYLYYKLWIKGLKVAGIDYDSYGVCRQSSYDIGLGDVLLSDPEDVFDALERRSNKLGGINAQ